MTCLTLIVSELLQAKPRKVWWLAWPLLFQKYASDPRPRIQGKNMNKNLDKIWPQTLQNKANSAVWGPYFCSYFCLVCGGWGCKKNPHYCFWTTSGKIQKSMTCLTLIVSELLRAKPSLPERVLELIAITWAGLHLSTFWCGFLTNLHKELEKQTSIHRNQKTIQWRKFPKIADFCPLSWSDVSWLLPPGEKITKIICPEYFYVILGGGYGKIT